MKSFRFLKLTPPFLAWLALSSAVLASLPVIPAELVHDFFPGEFSDYQPEPQLTRLGGTLFFVMSDLDDGPGVWRTDGTPGGTQRVLVPELSSFELQGLEILGTLGGRLLWSTGALGQPGVTWLLSAGPAGDATVLYRGPGVVQPKTLGGRMYFLSYTGEGYAIWMTDGTPAGTKPVPELASQVVDREVFETFSDRWLVFRSGSSLLAWDLKQKSLRRLLSSQAQEIQILPVEQTLFIVTRTPRQDQVWSIRLTSQRATLLFTGRNIGIAGWRENRLYFAPESERLWSSDGTRQGTRPYSGARVENFSLFASRLGAIGSSTLIPMPGYYWSGLLAADENRHELREILPVCSGKYECLGTTMSPITMAAGWAFLKIDRQLAQTDGTRQGSSFATRLIDVDPETFRVFDDHLVLGGARDGVAQLWGTDGTFEGTKALSDGTQDEPFYVKGPPISYNGALFVAADRRPVGQQLWRIGGGRTSPITDLRHLASGAEPIVATPVGERILINGSGLDEWTSVGEDGSVEGIQSYEDICAYATFEPCSTPAIPVGKRLLYARFSAEIKLWSTDGTAAGTLPMPDPENEERTLTAAALGRLGDRALVLDESGRLWTSDGSASGLTKIAELPIDRDNPVRYQPVGAPVPLGSLTFLFRRAPDGGNTTYKRLELWRTDGTAAGTLRLVTIPFPEDSWPYLSPATVGGYLFFRHGGVLWRSDGTLAGTNLVSEAPWEGEILGLAAGASILYAVAGDPTGEGPSTLWAIDPRTLTGKLLGTFNSVRDALVGQGSLNILGDTLFFAVSTPEEETEIWRTEGTPESTRPLSGLPASAKDAKFFTANGERYFTACEPEHGCELWATDRLGENVRLVQDFWPGPRNGFPEILAVNDEFLLVAATEPTVGRELWKIDLSSRGSYSQ